jgi:enoyl-CoA hydratase/carnithine racemase
VVIYGGENVFPAGADIKEMAGASYEQIAAISQRLPAALRAIDDGLETDLGTGLEIERLQFSGLFTTEDQRAGMRSFVENGPGKATFTGR